ncbi:heme biosynthesis protein HemY [Pelagibacterium lentulum]|uniref:Heme biosynthesis protein HemY n=1 Tax=Pelagibacterium lentulum TaxID=2029865 RepID=A0A916R5Y4_9HYPH|nr:heme biosynthesis HemY N-terminal domain-containing protein [Pelagibacterium lentulum]GGA36237.1 heme biosynthesis protein HemY [Pelagibacterium lentulum]
MTRLVLYLVASLVLALGAAWLIAMPGTVSIEVANYRLEPGLGTSIALILGLIVVSILVWAIIRRVIEAPGRLARHTERKKQAAGVEALSDGLIALQAGEYSKARMLARDARAKLPGNSAAQLLEARAELALGDLPSAREHYRALISDPKTALAALAGLYEQANTQNRPKAALTFARKAVMLAPSLDWASNAVFNDLAARGAWADALEMSISLPARTKAQKEAKKRRQGVLETALAHAIEDTEPEAALNHAQAALRSIPNFVPAALIAARIHINRGDTRKASWLLTKVWRATHHRDVATLYAHVTPGSSALERLKRMKTLVEADATSEPAAAMTLARAAIDAHEWSLARNALAPYSADAPTQTICTLMAEIEEGQSGDQGKARAWLARAITAPRDPVWTADGITADQWAPTSPITGQLDAFEWKVPVSAHRPAAIAPDGHAQLPGASAAIEAIANEPKTISAEPATAKPNGAGEATPPR